MKFDFFIRILIIYFTDSFDKEIENSCLRNENSFALLVITDNVQIS